MRITNGIGAIIALFLAVAIDWVFIEPTYNFIDGSLTGDARVLALIGMVVVFGFITIVIPVLMAVEDTKQEVG